MSLNLSRKQLVVLETLQRLGSEQGYMPSVRELAQALKLSPATTQQHLNALKKKGFITTDGNAHGIRVVQDPPGSAADPRGNVAPIRPPTQGGRPSPKRRAPPPSSPSSHGTSSSDDTLPIPIVGTIAAGRPIEAIEESDDHINVAMSLARSGDYALRVQGQSMIDDGILNGDLVLIRPQEKVENGQIAVALLEDGAATLKRIYREKGRIRLQPANREMAPFFVDDVRIQGRVVGLLRIYN